MAYTFVIEPQLYIDFENEAEQLDKCKEWGLLSDKASKTKVFYYKGNGKNEVCSIIGYVDHMTAVIEFDNKQKHCIHPSYLKEMQASGFGQRYASRADTDGDADASDELLGQGEEGLEPAAVLDEAIPSLTDKPAAEVPVIDKTKTQTQTQESQAQEWEAHTQASAASASPKTEPTIPAAAVEPAKAKPSKSKSAKIQLPEEKVKMIATVKEFTTVPNHFSDNDDEVIIYESVAIVDPETELGEAWSSHSATIKKLELSEGDTITFEAKVAAKKLTKHPVPYKINNPSKIQKQEA